MKKFYVFLTATLMLQSVAFAAAPMSHSTRLQGTVTAIGSNSITVSTKSGTQTVAFDPKLRVLELTKSSLDKVRNNSFIGTTVVPQPDGSYKSTEVHVFAESLRGMGEGFTKMNPAGSRMMANAAVHMRVNMMANATVHNAMTSGSGKTISMSFPGKNIIIHIPPNVPVSFINTASRAQLQKGKAVLLICNGNPGKFIARTIVVIEPGASLM
jgi:hypothetical protein